jgi:hypothetical protein
MSSEIHPSSCSMGTGVLSPVVMRPGRELNSSPSSAQVKNKWSHTSASPVLVYGMDRTNSTLYLYVPIEYA